MCRNSIIFVFVFVTRSASLEPWLPPTQGGAALLFDGVDDYIVAFPSFNLWSTWTIELWIDQRDVTRRTSSCLLNVATYSAANLLSVYVDSTAWVLKYGEAEYAVPRGLMEEATDDWNATWFPQIHHRPPAQQHLSISHRVEPPESVEAVVELRVDGKLVLQVNPQKLVVRSPAMKLLVGACYALTRNGVIRERHLHGYMDELRMWNSARSTVEVQSVLTLTGNPSTWPSTSGKGNGLVAQYSFDELSELSIEDTSGNGNHAIGGALRFPGESPSFHPSPFRFLRYGPRFVEVLSGYSGDANCNPQNCLNISNLLEYYVVEETEPEDRKFLAILATSLPQDLGFYISSDGTPATAISLNKVTTTDLLHVHASRGVVKDSLVVQMCVDDENVTDCIDGPFETFIFRILENAKPTAGGVFSLNLFGDSCFLQLQDHFHSSGAMEFWMKFEHLSGEQTVLSMSRRDLGRPKWKLDLPAISLSLTGGEVSLEICTVPVAGQEEPYVWRLPALATTELQHISFAWEYMRAARGRAVYRFFLYRNCVPVGRPIIVEDSCVHFGQKNDELHHITFGQKSKKGAQGFVATSFASMHIADIRLWTSPIAKSDICSRMRSLSREVIPQNLQARFLVEHSDRERGDSKLKNSVPRGQAASLQCTETRVACPDPKQLRGFEIEPSVFDLPPQPVELLVSSETSSDSPNETSNSNVQIEMPAFDRNNQQGDENIERVDVKVSELPSDCGVLMTQNMEETVRANDSFQPADLPLVFMPTNQSDNNSVCETSVKYVAVDSRGLESTFYAEIRLSVEDPGPSVTAVKLIEPGVPEAGPDENDIIAIKFDQPTSRSLDWRHMFTVEEGTLGRTDLIAEWNDGGDTLLLNVASPVKRYFRSIRTGVCQDHSMAPILNFEMCSRAALNLGIYGRVTSRDDPSLPEGCFFESNSLIFNLDPLSQGKGAETSVPGIPRWPICNVPPLQLVPNLTQLQFTGTQSTPLLRTAAEDSYPVVGLTPVVSGSFDDRFCELGNVFSPKIPDCTPCPSGAYHAKGLLACNACPAGTISPEPKSMSCEVCGLGKFSDTTGFAKKHCELAGPGQYVDVTGAVRPLACPIGTVMESVGRSFCERCPTGADCETLRSPRPRVFTMPLAAHFRTDSGQIVPCPLPQACLGWDRDLNKNICALGATGYLCQSCEVGFWRPLDRTRARCQKCTWSSPFRFVLVSVAQSAVVWVVAAMSVDAANWGNMHTVIFRLALNYFCVASSLSRIEQWEFEKRGNLGDSAVETVSTVLRTVFRFDGGVTAHLMGLECWLGGLAHEETNGQWHATKTAILLWSIAPLIWPVFLALVAFVVFEMYTLARRFVHLVYNIPAKHNSKAKIREVQPNQFVREKRLFGLIRTRAAWCGPIFRWTVVFKDCIPLIVVGQFLILPTVLRQLVVVLACEAIVGGNFRMVAAPDIKCFEGDHLTWAPIAATAMIVWGIFVPLLIVRFTWTRRSDILTDVKLRVLVGFLSDGYEQDWAFWESIIYGRKFLIILVGAVPGLSRPAEMALYQVIGVASVLLHYACKPFDNRSGELLDRIETYGLCMFLVQVTFIQTSFLADPNAEYDLLPILFACFLLALASVVMVMHTSAPKVYTSICLSGFFFITSNMYWFFGGIENRTRTAVMVLGLAIVLNSGYMLWLLWKVVNLVIIAWTDKLERDRAEEDMRLRNAPARDAFSLARNVRHLIVDSLPLGALVSKPPMPRIKGTSLIAKLRKTSQSLENSDARVWFDTEASELVLGLHADNFANDPRISNYIRRKLVASGPFLTQEERRLLATGIREALTCLIGQSDNQIIHTCLLEFVLRLPFAWQGRRHRLRGCLLVSCQDETAFIDEVLDNATFKRATLTPIEYQENLDKFTMQPKHVVRTLAAKFLDAFPSRLNKSPQSSWPLGGEILTQVTI